MVDNVVGEWDVVETVEVTERRIGKELLPVTITRRVGLCCYRDRSGKEIMADEATVLDFGPKLGVQRSYLLHPEVEPTEEERAANRARLLEVAYRAMDEQGLWDKIGHPA